MLDLKSIRDDPAAIDRALKRRGQGTLAAELLRLDGDHRAAIARLQALQQRRNEASEAIGRAKAKGEDAGAMMAEVASLKTAMAEATEAEGKAAEAVMSLLARVPNPPAEDVPDGMDPAQNVLLREVGKPRVFDFPARQHFELGEALGLMDFDAAAALSGARFVVLKGALARLERALAAFMLDLHTAEFGYQEVIPPFLVRDEAMFGTGQLPKFAQDLFATTSGHWLIPTAEVPLTNLVGGKILDFDALPLRFTAYTPCFRSEAGAAGKDTRGLIRQHQFGKVELVSIARPEQSEAEHERMTQCAEEVLKRLGLPYRVMVLCAGDMGFAARKTYDIEAWLPGQNAYREISSCSNCGDFQARRMKARYRVAGEKGTRFVHTLNGSALAIGRTMIAILENCQREDGGIAIPPVLHPYMSGMTSIDPIQ